MKELSDSDFDAFVAKSKVAVVDFWAPWCGPCRMAAPMLDELSKEFAGKIEFAKMNVDENQVVPGRFGVMSIPTFVIFKDGAQAGEIHGLLPKQEFKEALKEFV